MCTCIAKNAPALHCNFLRSILLSHHQRIANHLISLHSRVHIPTSIYVHTYISMCKHIAVRLHSSPTVPTNNAYLSYTVIAYNLQARFVVKC